MNFHKLIASGFGVGYSPFAPGTAGAALGIIVFYFFNFWLMEWNIPQASILILNLVLVFLFSILGNYSVNKVHSEWSNDSGKIVIDEIVGVWIAAIAMPLNWHYYLYAFILFRFFDISKIFFIKNIDKLKNNWSVMLDDILAGIYSLLILQGLYFFNII